jgi:5-formyltetrahydrofolate cyclo-ligase
VIAYDVEDAKQAWRSRVWSAMSEARVARFPGARGRIPNFTGAERAADRLAGLEVWERTTALNAASMNQYSESMLP